MIRTLRLALVAVAVFAVAGVAFAGDCSKPCDAAAKSACATKTSAAQAGTQSAADCAAACAAAGKTCTAAQQAACAGKANAAQAGSGCAAEKGAAQMTDCSYCGFIQDLHANAGKVMLSAEETEHGVVVVFAAVSKDDVAQAHAVAAKAYDMMSKPAACAVTKAKMASTSCDGCQKGLDAFAKSTVTMEKTDNGDKAMISADDEATVEQLHAFFRNLQAHAQQG